MIFLKTFKKLIRLTLKAFTNTSGVVVVEAAIIFSFISVLCVGALDYGFYLVWKGKIERVNHSITSVLRERTTLYDGNETITQAHVSQLFSLTKKITGNKTMTENACLTVEFILFDEKYEYKKIKTYGILYDGKKNCKSAPLRKLTDLVDLSPKSIRLRWMPIYQVTLSHPVPQGTLHYLLKNVGAIPDNVVVSNVALPR